MVPVNLVWLLVGGQDRIGISFLRLNTPATYPAPKFRWRIATVFGLWWVIFGFIMSVIPIHMEGGYDVTLEKLKVTLCAPLLGWLGLATFFGRHDPSYLSGSASLLIILVPTLWMLFRCRTTRAFWILTAVHVLIVTVSSIGFIQFSRYWSEGP